MPLSHRVIKLTIFLLAFNMELFPQDESFTKIDSVNSIPYKFIVSNVKESIRIFSDNLKRSQVSGYEKGIAFSNSNLGLAYYIGGQYDKSALCYIKAINKFEQLELKEALSVTLGEFGYQLKRRDMDKANYYMRQGIKIAEANKYDSILIKLYNNYGVLKEMENNVDSAIFFYEKALKYVTEKNDSLGIPYSLNKIAGIYLLKNRFTEALDLMKKSDLYRNREEGEFGRIENLVLYADIYKGKGDTDKAIKFYESALQKSIDEDISYLIRYCYQQLSELYSSKGRYKDAFAAFNSYTIYKDSALNEDVQLKIAELEIDYQTEKKDKEIAENRLEISEKNSQLFLMLGLLVLLSFASFVIFVYYKRKREQLELNSKLHQAEFEKKLSDEKLRISRELHDNIGSQLTFMVSSIDNYLYKSDDKNNVLNNVSEFGRDALKELRNTIWALKQEEADISRLILKINELVYKINNSIDNIKITTVNKIKNEIVLSSIQLLNLYRIIQEAIQNSVKHSKATKITIEFSLNEKKLILNIQDNGNGFNLESVNNGNGLESMEKRCEECGGEFNILSSTNGTEIICAVKIN